MSDIKLGTPPEPGAQRDAFHVAVIPVTSRSRLKPGGHVCLVTGKTAEVRPGLSGAVGIIDPFLRLDVEPGQPCWLLLYPQTVTSLRHEWTHPEFPDAQAPTPVPAAKISRSERWICEYADRMDLTYHDLMNGADNWLRDGDYLSHGAKLEGVSLPDTFWTHYEEVTQRKVPEHKKESFFSCSC